MFNITFLGLMIPFIGTSLGASCVLFMKKGINKNTTKVLGGFAAGVMVAASIWSLLIPAIEQAFDMGRLAFVPAVVGFVLGMLFLLVLESKSTMLVLAVTLHNIPEGMAVGVLYAGLMTGDVSVTEVGAMALSIGIAIQNIPEGAIISMPLHNSGISKRRACIYGILSGVVEPIAGFVTVLAASVIVPALPYLLGFAAGAMMYVVIDELVPQMAEGITSDIANIAFMTGFCLMMILDVAFS